MPFATDPRRPSGRELADWYAAAIARGIEQEDLDAIRAYIKRHSPRRWERFQRDYRHIGKVISKIGMNPEDARWLL